MAYDPKKHHRRSIRLPEYDYTQPGAYYITICTYERQCWFGDVENGKMQKNYLGYIAHNFWQALPRRFPHIELDVFVVMPNHLHGILIITDEGYRTLPKNRPRKEQFGKPVPGSIPTVVRSFKSAVTRRINLMRRTKMPPIWQGNYYESIVRVETGLDAIRQYIINNPLEWEIDEDNIKYHSNQILDLGLDF
ncbi:MAG TPA: transposase [Cyanobacteria bacterium UBA11369]|nr:transposase [Cyanobacteria bacterium UBA11371]HBE32379.1 transposase [Cyanobacteria bacterium UBA11368]HBE47565.1 transposase [Cyanobacteria bacterium UBA11369]